MHYRDLDLALFNALCVCLFLQYISALVYSMKDPASVAVRHRATDERIIGESAMYRTCVLVLRCVYTNGEPTFFVRCVELSIVLLIKKCNFFTHGTLEFRNLP
eukprot:COSAG02_NODE_2605_length_8442_cov_9.552080_3_plen_103_part_00